MILKDDKGRELKVGDLSDYTGTVNWSIADPKDIPEAARVLLNRGQEVGAGENYQEALHLFAQAAQIAPDWAYPIYESAFTYLLMGDLERAERDYLQVERLEPRGFFTYQAELDCVRRERNGEFRARHVPHLRLTC
jgi:tetratricopeptide (TPR) repeat protein